MNPRGRAGRLAVGMCSVWTPVRPSGRYKSVQSSQSIAANYPNPRHRSRSVARATARRNRSPQTGASRSKTKHSGVRGTEPFWRYRGDPRLTDDVIWKGSVMKKSMLPSIAFLAAALAVGGAGIATDAFARGGHGGGGHFHGAGGFGSAGGFSAGDAPSVLPTPLTPNTPLGRDVKGLTSIIRCAMERRVHFPGA